MFPSALSFFGILSSSYEYLNMPPNNPSSTHSNSPQATATSSVSNRSVQWDWISFANDCQSFLLNRSYLDVVFLLSRCLRFPLAYAFQLFPLLFRVSNRASSFTIVLLLVLTFFFLQRPPPSMGTIAVRKNDLDLTTSNLGLNRRNQIVQNGSRRPLQPCQRRLSLLPHIPPTSTHHHRNPTQPPQRRLRPPHRPSHPDGRRVSEPGRSDYRSRSHPPSHCRWHSRNKQREAPGVGGELCSGSGGGKGFGGVIHACAEGGGAGGGVG